MAQSSSSRASWYHTGGGVSSAGAVAVPSDAAAAPADRPCVDIAGTA